MKCFVYETVTATSMELRGINQQEEAAELRHDIRDIVIWPISGHSSGLRRELRVTGTRSPYFDLMAAFASLAIFFLVSWTANDVRARRIGCMLTHSIATEYIGSSQFDFCQRSM